ncbi:MAG: competence/damage-inducible protein A [Oscillospiraceae bacterium]|nr:competence/damage-inducible protein A [Oscillospiraceae bacterium]
MKAEIIAVGTELLLGDIVNTNAQYLAKELAQLGITVHYQSVVGDNPARLTECVKQAKSRSDILLFSGGLGPTEDDLTKETVAAAFGDTLVFDAAQMEKIESFFKRTGRPMAPNNRKQAMIPAHGKKIENDNGTAPGVIFADGTQYAILMPGPPKELKPMFEARVKPFLKSLCGGAIVSISMREFGIGESHLETIVKPFLDDTNPTTALYAKDGEVLLRITAKAESTLQAQSICAARADEVQAALGAFYYGRDVDGLEEVVVPLLAQKQLQIATAESCTGGLLSSRITNVSGASSVFSFGCCTYANIAKEKAIGVSHATLQQFGAVSSQTAGEMAAGVAKAASAHIGVGITGIAGPTGGTPEKPVGLVYIGVYYNQKVYIKKITEGERGRAHVRWMATQNALDMVRRLLQGLPCAEDVQIFCAGEPADINRHTKSSI